ncbi:MAG: acetylxylan esterase [Alphaproteobacteria bacterium]|nr:acetylxylan esterase [Alphaproteobacteria bacterium]
MIAGVLHRIQRARLACAIALALLGVVLAMSVQAPIDASARPTARPEVLGAFDGAPAIETQLAWAQRRRSLQRVFQDEIYGHLPSASITAVRPRRPERSAYHGAATVSSFDVDVAAVFGHVASPTRTFRLDLIVPASATAARPAPIVLMETFCPLVDDGAAPAVTHGGPLVTCTSSLQSRLVRFLFGFQIASPPTQELLDRGYAIAMAFPGDVVPDDPKAGVDALNALAGPMAGDRSRWGAIAAWAWTYSRMIDAVLQDPRIDRSRIAVLGHSRYGKAALVAAAFDERIAAVVSRASGAGGAALSREKIGERIGGMMRAYPHWFAPRFRHYAGLEDRLPIDQHQLLALIAPRAVFLANGREDVWSDPIGVWRAAESADAAWKLLGARGLDQVSPLDFNPHADISYRLREGPHWALRGDWPDILAFLDAHIGSEADDSEMGRMPMTVRRDHRCAREGGSLGRAHCRTPCIPTPNTDLALTSNVK